jgi:hypothetical protein
MSKHRTHLQHIADLGLRHTSTSRKSIVTRAFVRREQRGNGSACLLGLMRSGNEHAVAIAEKTVARFDRMVIGGQDTLPPRKGADQHEKA